MTYSSQPVRAAESLRQAGSRVFERLSDVTCPLFIGHGALDRTTPLANAWLLAQRVRSNDIEVHVFPHSGHILTKDGDRALLQARLDSFIRRIASTSA